MKSVVRYSPRSLSLYDDFDRLVNSFFSDSNSPRSSLPSVDIHEQEEAYLLEAELPGLEEKDIQVKVEDQLLTISATRSEEKEQKKDGSKGYILRERASRSFNRCFVLPRDVDREAIEAHYANGLLTLRLAKSETAKPRQIEVKAGN